MLSGLICLNWYDWNYEYVECKKSAYDCRDWSAWIDTIETTCILDLIYVHLISRDWSAWIDTIETCKDGEGGWSACLVGIDLPELIRLKPWRSSKKKDWLKLSRDWSAWIDTIETDFGDEETTKAVTSSGLICLNWYDWNTWTFFLHTFPKLNRRDWSAWIDTIETRFRSGLESKNYLQVGIDLPELIRLKHPSLVSIRRTLRRRDWSAWIDTIETNDYCIDLRLAICVGIDLPELIRLKLSIRFSN